MNRKIKRVGRTALSSVLILGMVFCNSSFIQAKQVSKEESVYVNATEDGTVSQITVADWLKGSGITGSIEDSSNLTEITNVKGDEKFSQSGKDVSWAAAGNDIYYQGKSTQELPVDVKITYTMDGKEMTAKDMLGKSGEVKIHVSYTNKSKQTKQINGEDVTIYTPFIMVTGMILSSDNFTDVEIDHGRIINDGSNNIIVGVGTPGLAESLNLKDDYSDKLTSDFTVTAKAVDFSMGNTFTYTSPSLLDDLNLDDLDDLNELEDKLNDLTDAASELVDGSDKIADNMSLFAEKMDTLKDKMQTYKSGVDTLNKGINTLAGNGTKLVSGVKEYADGVTTLANGTTSYVGGADKIAKGNRDLYDAVQSLPSSFETFNKGLKTYTDGVDALGAKENITALKTGASSVSAGITTVHDSLSTLKASFAKNEQIIAGLKASLGANNATVAALEQVTAGQKSAIEKLEAGTGEKSDLKNGADQLSAGVAKVMDNLGKLSANSATLTGGASTINSKLPTLVASIKTLKEGGETLTANDKKLLSGAKALVKASKTMKKTAKKLNAGMKTLQKGSKKINTATGQLNTAVGKLDTASGKLSDGADTLSEGMSKFNQDGIEKLNRTYEDDVKSVIDRVKAVVNAGKDYESFSGKGSAMKGEVKFVIETAEVKKEEDED